MLRFCIKILDNVRKTFIKKRIISIHYLVMRQRGDCTKSLREVVGPFAIASMADLSAAMFDFSSPDSPANLGGEPLLKITP